MNKKKQLLEEIKLNLYRIRDTLRCMNEYNTHESKCQNFILSTSVIELCHKEKIYLLNELARLISDFLPRNDYSNLEKNRLLKFLRLDNKICSTCGWKFSSTFSICEYTLKLTGFNKNSPEYHCLIKTFREVEDDGTFEGCGYNSRNDEFYINYVWDSHEF